MSRGRLLFMKQVISTNVPSSMLILSWKKKYINKMNRTHLKKERKKK